MSHDWECIAPTGYYFWRCRRCGTTRPYPDPNPPKDECPPAIEKAKEAL
jgi:hypothetical protein